MDKHEELLLALLAATVDHNMERCHRLLPADIDTWEKVLHLAGRQGVTGLALSAIEYLPKHFMPPINPLMNFMGLAGYQRARYRRQVIIAQKFAKALKERHVEIKVLKGISFSTYYDEPALRECGDCDCYLSIKDRVVNSFSDSCNSRVKAGSTGFEIGNKTIEEIGGCYKFGSYKHSHLFMGKLMFENHRYVTDFNGTEQGKKTELLLERVIESEPGIPITLTLDGKTRTTDLLRPCAHFCALHCLRHAHGNLMLGGMVLRMLYDWAMIMRAEQENLDWERMNDDLNNMRLALFAGVMSSICEKYLGLKLTAEGVIRCDDEALVDEIMIDTLRCDIHPMMGESLWRKTVRIWKRFVKMYHFRSLAVESVPMMIWNCFAFSSYMKRNLELD